MGRSTGSVELKSCSTISERIAASSGVGPRSGTRPSRSAASGPRSSRAMSRRAARACSRRWLHLRRVIIARIDQSSSQSASSNASRRHRRKKLLQAERTASSTSIRSRIQPSNCRAARPTSRRAYRRKTSVSAASSPARTLAINSSNDESAVITTSTIPDHLGVVESPGIEPPLSDISRLNSSMCPERNSVLRLACGIPGIPGRLAARFRS